ncbi:hypothetical protein LUZ63_018464 [Rhynchospora breviuscula]|uniref:ATP-dependent DNA helicase n=1 Tax=Rhynchospora breviuscula TaxID=2022672 RepID=A0A9Q0HI40_9POAL|nr:hypothetical protein LUZ63_018464 [Rhynchospora breviuscula]
MEGSPVGDAATAAPSPLSYSSGPTRSGWLPCVNAFLYGVGPFSQTVHAHPTPPSIDSDEDFSDAFCASAVSSPETPPAEPVYSTGIFLLSLDNRLSYLDFGDPDEICTHCHARFWFEERCRTTSRVGAPVYTLCCRNGRVDLGHLDPMPQTLYDLLDPNGGLDSSHFIDNIRMYNSMFAFTSMGVQLDESVNTGRGPYAFKVSGQLCHLLGSLLPDDDSPPRFAQLYMYDTDNEVSNRIAPFPSTDRSSTPRPHIVQALKEMLDQYNPYAQVYRSVRDRVLHDTSDTLRLRIRADRSHRDSRYSAPSASEIAGLVVGDLDSQHFVRDIIVQRRSGALQRVSSVHPSYMPFQYPLIFTRGEDGFTPGISYNQESESARKIHRDHVTMAEYYCYRLHMRTQGSPIISKSGRLLQQLSIDMFACVDQARLWYIHENQASLRSDTYANVRDAVVNNDMFGRTVGKRIVLPASHVGRPRYMYQNYQDAIAVCRHLGSPHLFITFTCNPAWPEITRNLLPRQCANDRPDLVCRVFKMKLAEMVRDIRDSEFFGPVSGLIYSVEFQKRGLPHVHIIVWLRDRTSLSTPTSVDRFISAELPSPVFDPQGYSVVSQFMVHGPCGSARPNSPCMHDGKCTKRFPKPYRQSTVLSDDGFVLYKRRDSHITVTKGGVCMDNRYVVPYNLNLLLKYNAHINVERCHRTDMIKYLFKYICKGRDRAMVSVFRNDSRTQASSTSNTEETVVDEVLDYLDCRYLTAPEAVWRLFQYDIHFSFPTVERLPIHLPLENSILFRDSQQLLTIVSNPASRKTKLTAWFDLNARDPIARQLTYPEVTKFYTWHENEKAWRLREQGYRLARVHFIQPTAGDLYYERMLLNSVRGAASFEALRTVNGVLHGTYKEACNALGLLDDNSEWLYTIQEAAASASCDQLRAIFVDILLYSDVADARDLWESCWTYMGDDITREMRSAHGNFQLTIDAGMLKDYILHKLADLLFIRGYSLQYVDLPLPVHSRPTGSVNRLLSEQYSYNTADLRMEVPNLLSGKTFLWRAITAVVRSQGRVVLTVASSGLSSLLLDGGVTAYSRFKIPLKLREGSTCDIKKNTNLVELLRETALIIWDEAPMSNRICFEALDRSMRDILADSGASNRDKTFGGVTVVLGGDFRQTLPVVPHSTRFETVAASITNSYLWPSCRLFRLTINMRLLTSNSQLSDRQAISVFACWLLSVGNGTAPGIPLYNCSERDWIKIPDKYLLHHAGDKVSAIITAVYGDLQCTHQDDGYLRVRAIIAPKNDAVKTVNETILGRIPREQRDYLSHDSIHGSEKIAEDIHAMYPTDILNTITAGSLPCHKLSLKIGVPVMLLRNMDQSKGLCNSTRLVITELGARIVHARIITGSGIGKTVQIPRIVFLHEDERLPFIFRRKQFPLRVCYAMTINKSQGQSLDVVGVYLPEPVFAHGQLYVALSRATSPNSLKILIDNPDSSYPNYTRNISVRTNGQSYLQVIMDSQLPLTTTMNPPVPVLTLTPTTDTEDVKIHGRPVRIWQAADARYGRVYNMAFLFIDHTVRSHTLPGAKIQGLIAVPDYQRISAVFTEDNLCEITRFTLEGSTPDYQVVKHPYVLSLTRETAVAVLQPNMYDIPRNCFDFVSFREIGVSVTHLKAVMGIYGLKTYSGTRFHMDPSLKEIADYLAATPQDGMPITLHATAHTYNIHIVTPHRADPIKVTMAQLNGLYLDNYNENYYQCAGVVMSINNRFDWYYESCPDCRRKLGRTGDRLWCDHCKTRRMNSIPWYKIRVQAVDQTGDAQFVLLGRLGEEAVGMPAQEVVALQQQDRKKTPAPLIGVIGKKFMFTFAGKQRVPYQENRIYTVVNLDPVPSEILELLPQPILHIEAAPMFESGSSTATAEGEPRTPI